MQEFKKTAQTELWEYINQVSEKIDSIEKVLQDIQSRVCHLESNSDDCEPKEVVQETYIDKFKEITNRLTTLHVRLAQLSEYV